MNIHEYQTKELLRGYGVPVPDGRVAHNVDNAATAAEELGGERWVVKAQIHAGGRGKGGGVKVASFSACWWSRPATSKRNTTGAW